MRRPVRTAALLAFVLAVACGPGAKQRFLDTSLKSLNAAMSGVEAWDETEQQRIVDRATSFEEGQAQLATHRERRQRIIKAATLAYSALALVAIEPEPANLAAASAAVVQFVQLVREFTGGAP
jgi:hypothetical protein